MPFGLHIDGYSEAFMFKNKAGIKQESGWRMTFGNLAIVKDLTKIYKIHVAFGQFSKSPVIESYLRKRNYISKRDGSNVVLLDNYDYDEATWLGYSKLIRVSKKPTEHKFGLIQYFGYGINASKIHLGQVNAYLFRGEKVDKFTIVPTWKFVAEFGI